MSKHRVCAVIGCNNINYYVYKNPDGVEKRFFRFPRAKSMCIRWIEKLNRLDLYPILEEKGSLELWTNYRVCSDHFLAEDFTKLHPYMKVKGLRKRSTSLLAAAVPSQNLGNENEIYVATAPPLQLLEEIEADDEVENEVTAEPLPELPQTPDLSPLFPPVEESSESVVTELVKPQNVAKKSRKTAKDVIEDLRYKMKITEHLVNKYRLEMKAVNENFKELDLFKNKYLDYHSVDACKGKDLCSCQRDFALDLYMKSPQVYKYLQQNYFLPHTSVLYRWKLQKEQEALHEQLKLIAEP